MKKPPTNDYYSVLGLDRGASQAEIKAAYRQRAPHVHPDRGGSQEEMAALNEAYDCLSDTPRRLLYDQTGQDSRQHIDQEVRSLLMDEFATALNSDATDILAAVRSSLKTKLAGILQNRVETLAAQKKFETKRSKVKTKKGADNLYHLVIDKQLMVISAGLLLLERQEKLLKTALSQLDTYVSEEQASSYTTSNVTTLWQSLPPGW